jgi:uncharacterized membrane protein (UPF0127 family)
MEIYRESAVFIIIFLIAIMFLFLYAQFSTAKRQITLVNRDGERINLTVEVADNPVKRARGLMFRKSLGENEGMLFIFDKPGKHGFWMVNTTIPLDAVFFDENRTAVDIVQMNPCGITGCRTYYPEEEALYVLEVNQGFAVANKIEKGKSSFILE